MAIPNNGCTFNASCCTDSSGSIITGFDGGFVSGSKCTSSNCSARNAACYETIVGQCANPSYPDKLFSSTGVCAIAAADPAYKDIITNARAVYCASPANYNNYNGYCVNWWANDPSSNGIATNDDSVKQFCETESNKTVWKDQYQGVCGCFNSTITCPDPLDQYCVGNELVTPKIPRAYHTRKVLDQKCDSITLCTQETNIGDDSFALGVQKQICGDLVETGAFYFWILIIIVIISIAANVYYVRYMMRNRNNGGLK